MPENAPQSNGQASPSYSWYDWRKPEHLFVAISLLIIFFGAIRQYLQDSMPPVAGLVYEQLLPTEIRSTPDLPNNPGRESEVASTCGEPRKVLVYRVYNPGFANVEGMSLLVQFTEDNKQGLSSVIVRSEERGTICPQAAESLTDNAISIHYCKPRPSTSSNAELLAPKKSFGFTIIAIGDVSEKWRPSKVWFVCDHSNSSGDTITDVSLDPNATLTLSWLDHAFGNYGLSALLVFCLVYVALTIWHYVCRKKIQQQLDLRTAEVSDLNSSLSVAERAAREWYLVPENRTAITSFIQLDDVFSGGVDCEDLTKRLLSSMAQHLSDPGVQALPAPPPDSAGPEGESPT